MNPADLTRGRLAVVAAFALSCFGLVLFLWQAFGGPVPLAAEGYRVDVPVPDAVGLYEQADVRIAGLSVGTVVALRRDGRRTVATVEVDPRYAPLRGDTRAMLRRKSVLGEAFLALTPGTRASPALREGDRLAAAQVREAVELDEVLNALQPGTRQAFRDWQQDLAAAGDGRGPDLNAALGQLPQTVTSLDGLLGVLAARRRATRTLVGDARRSLQALTRDGRALQGLVANADAALGAAATQRTALTRAVQALPPFLQETRTTLTRLDASAREWTPTVRGLVPVGADLRAVVADARALAPDLRSASAALPTLARTSSTALPALTRVADAATPLLRSLEPWLANLNPVIRFASQYQQTLANFMSLTPTGLAARVPTTKGVGHYLRQLGIIGPSSLGFATARRPGDRGNTYLPPNAYDEAFQRNQIFPSFDCKNAGGERPAKLTGADRAPGCRVAEPLTLAGGGRQGAFPHVVADDLRRPDTP